ncbi:MAG: alpha-2-macroglobulin family protein [Ignavibacteria bacterium]
MSIGVVDESIYSIKEDRTKDIRKFSTAKGFGVSTGYSNNNNSYGQSRLITIYERFNLKSANDKDLGTVKGKLQKDDGTPVSDAIIVINEDYMAAITDIDGNFEFKLPEGEYEVQVYSNSKSKDGSVDIDVEKGSIKIINLKISDDNELVDADDKSSLQNLRGGRTDESEIVNDGMMMSAPEKKMESSPVVSEVSQLVTPDVRSDFRDAIFWSPYTVTDGEGYAIVDVKYPDNLTTWRITSRVITEDTKVGQMVSSVITRKDLLIRMETPRFLQENDELVISTIVHNYLGAEKQTKVKFTGENIFLMEDSDERTISIAPNTDVRLDWKIRVIQPIGEAKLYAEALTDEESDAMEVKVPLQPKGLKITETAIADFSDQNKTETKILNIPTGTDLRSSEITIAVDPSLASTLLTSMDELIGYPYGCVEQTMSRFLPTVIVANTFRDLNIPVSDATAKELPLMVNKGLQRLYGFQNSNGGWGWWQYDDGNPFMTAYVVYGLNVAKQAGYEVNESVFKKGITSIKRQLKSSDLDATTRAYMIYTLAGIGEKDKLA